MTKTGQWYHGDGPGAEPGGCGSLESLPTVPSQPPQPPTIPSAIIAQEPSPGAPPLLQPLTRRDHPVNRPPPHDRDLRPHHQVEYGGGVAEGDRHGHRMEAMEGTSRLELVQESRDPLHSPKQQQQQQHSDGSNFQQNPASVGEGVRNPAMERQNQLPREVMHVQWTVSLSNWETEVNVVESRTLIEAIIGNRFFLTTA